MIPYARRGAPSLATALRERGGCGSRHLLTVSVLDQSMHWWESIPQRGGPPSFRQRFVISTSRFGTGQLNGSFQTPLGLHRVARKIGGGRPIGTAFRARQPIGYTWQGLLRATICHRILWLEGLEPGHNRGGAVDTFKRYVYIHGFCDESTLGRPMSHGCIHMAAADLIPLYDRIPAGTLVWITHGGQPACRSLP